MGPPGSAASLERWLRWLETLSPREIDLGLERVSQLLGRLKLRRPDRVFTIGGTNGKGSSVVMLDALLRESGAQTGSYLSPHVLHYCERIRLNGVPVGEAAVIDAFERIETVRHDTPLTYFEFGTLAAMCVFAAADVDVAILEVGLGGRLDAVNAIEHDGCLITNVSLDHCDWLGNDVETIAFEKAGIMRRGKAAVFGAADRPATIDACANARDAQLVAAGRDFSFSTTRDGRWNWSGAKRQLTGLTRPYLQGEHQLWNASAVLALLEAVGETSPLTKERVDQALSGADLPGRHQRVDARGRRWLVDGAHNAAGAAVLSDALATVRAQRVVAVVGILDDKDVEAIVRSLESRVDSWIAVTAPSGRALPAERLALTVAATTGQPCRAAPSVDLALEYAQAMTSGDDLIIVAGSFYTVAAALRELKGIGV